jgi:hypothetical protein
MSLAMGLLCPLVAGKDTMDKVPEIISAQVTLAKVQQAAFIFIHYFMIYLVIKDRGNVDALARLIETLESGEDKVNGPIYRRAKRLSENPSAENIYRTFNTLDTFRVELAQRDPKLKTPLETALETALASLLKTLG